MEEAQPLFREKTDELLKEKEQIIVEQNITIQHLKKEVAGLKDKIRSFNARNVNRKLKKNKEKIKKIRNHCKKNEEKRKPQQKRQKCTMQYYENSNF